MPAPGLPLVFARSFPVSLSQRYAVGAFGRGWSHNWDYHFEKSSVGDVTIVGQGGSRRLFQPDSRGGYFAQDGDHGTLTSLSFGGYSLRETDGLVRAFRSDGKLDYIADTNGNQITCQYTGALLTGLNHSNGQSLTIHYSGGYIRSVTDPVGRAATFSYSGDHLTGVQYFDGSTVGYTYDPGATATLAHALTAIAYPGGTHRYFGYGSNGRLISTSRDGGAENWTLNYEGPGLVGITDGTGNQTNCYFDHRGLLVKETDPLGNTVRMDFDPVYNLTQITDPTGSVSDFTYDNNGNLVSSTNAVGETTRLIYSASFNCVAQLTDAKGNTTRYSHDSGGNLLSVTYPDGSLENWTYSAGIPGRATTWTNRRGNAGAGASAGHVITYSYDSTGRRVSKIYADGSHADYAYDTRGNLQSATDANGTATFTHDPATDRLTRIDYPGGRWLAFTYNAAGQRATSLDQTGHQLTYHYDSAGRLGDVESEDSVQEVVYNYDAAGRISLKTLGSGVYTTYAYDTAGRLLTLVNYQPGGAVISFFDYTYDTRGRRITMGTVDGDWSYTYDDLGQLIHAVFAPASGSTAPAQDEAFVYDALGNRVSTVINGVTTTYTTNNLNQYVTVGGLTYAYDSDGNLTQQGLTTYTYNDDNRLTALNDGTNQWQYTYDALGQRVATTKNGATTRYIFDPIGPGDVVGEYNGAGSLTANYDHGLGLISRTDTFANVAYYVFDGIGSTSELTTAAGVVADSYRYTPFGATLASTGAIGNPFQFAGESGAVADDTGLNYVRTRAFDPSSGRFDSVAPLNLLGGDVNLYGYRHNSPLQPSVPGALGQSCNRSLFNGGANPWATGAVWRKTGAGFGDLELVHPHYVLDAGSDLGSGGGSVFGSFPGNQSNLFGKAAALEGAIPASGEFSDALMRVALDGITGSSLARAEHDGISSNGMDWAELLREAYQPVLQEQGGGTSEISLASDPNSVTGPAGYGPNRYISPNGILAYRVNFENEPTAAAPAQNVSVTDPLSGNLDPTTFELTGVGFGDQFISVPAGTTSYATTVPMSYGGVDFVVQIQAGIQLSTGQIYATFKSVVPATGLPPPVNVGFLPPEDGSGRGTGYVAYVVRPKAGLPTGTEIRDVATIVFDTNAPIATDQVDPHDPFKGTDPTKEALVTIDADTPKSSVSPLPADIGSGSFTVTWSGSDAGAGIAGYDIYVSIDGGSWTLWQAGTAATSATYPGQIGHTYAFYSVAIDGSGNREAAPATADAQTSTVIGGPIAPAFTTQPVSQTVAAGSTTTFTVAVSGNPAPTYQWQVLTNGGNTWTNLTEIAPYSGTATGTLTITGATAAMNSYEYQCLASNSVASNAVTITVTAANVAPSFAGGQPLNQMVTAGYTTTFTVTASGNPAPTYQWQVLTNGGSVWSNLTETAPYSGITTGTLTITGATVAINGYQYRCLASNFVQSNVASQTATLGVIPSAATVDPGEGVISAGFTATWNSAGGATGYRLDVSTDSSFNSFVGGYQNLDVGDVTSATLGGLNPNTTYYYRVRAYDSAGTGANSITITVTTSAPITVATPLTVSTLAGQPLISGENDGTGNAARFYYPSGIAADSAGNLYLADTDNHTIRKIIASTGAVTTFAGLAGNSGDADGTGSGARFYSPSSVAVDGAGNVYVADTLNDTLRKVTASGVVSTLAGSPGVAGSVDGTGTGARFHGPQGLTIDTSGILYVADTNNHTIRMVVPSTGAVTTLAGLAGNAGSNDGTGSAARFNYPAGVAVDRVGELYVADTENHTLRLVAPVGLVANPSYLPGDPMVSTIAGLAGYSGGADGTGSAARFDSPSSVAVDSSGNLYVADTDNFTIRKVVPSTGAVSTLAGLAGTSGSTDGLGSAVRFYRPAGIAVDASSNLYVADTDNDTIRLGLLAMAPVIQTQPQSQAVTAGGSVQFSVTVLGRPAVTYQWHFGSTPISGATSSTYSLSDVQSANAGGYSVVVTNSLGSATSNTADLTVSQPTPTTTIPQGGSGGGGGAPSEWFCAALLLLAAARRYRRRTNVERP